MTQFTFSNNLSTTKAYVRFLNDTQAVTNTDLFQASVNQYFKQQVETKKFSAKANEIASTATLGLTAYTNAVLAGVSSDATLADYKELGAVVAKQLRAIDADSAVINLVDLLSNDKKAESLQAFVEGLQLALYHRTIKKKKDDPFFVLNEVNFVLNDELASIKASLETAVQTANVLVESINFARNLTNMAGNVLIPEKLAFYAEELAHELEVDVEVLDEWLIAEENMGGLLAVGQGSVNLPRMIVLHYDGNPNSNEKYGLIGKGMTFDTGGISIKPALNMEEMISDMAGAAAVLGAFKAIVTMKLPVNVVVVVPTAENMPSDRAFKPGDVITTMSGHTIEVVNTDAEGRLILADGLTTAIKRGATKLVDVATLTGAALVALGTEATAAVTNNDELFAEISKASETSGERVWQLPAYPEYKKLIKSDVADLKNSGGRHAGTITGGLFIGHFAENLPWVHLDIAGPSFISGARKWETKGGTGVMVRTLFELLNQKV